MMTEIANFPAYRIVALPDGHTFTHGDEFAIPYQSGRYGTMYRMFTLGSVAGYATQYGEDPEAAVQREKERGHEIYWANQNSSVLTAWDRPQETYVQVNHGDVITLEGKRFRIDPAWNNNVKLTEVA